MAILGQHKIKLSGFTNIQRLALCGLFLASLMLNLAAQRWGLPNDTSWHPDSIAGMESVLHSKHLFVKWGHKYPRGQFIINAVCYKPFLMYWVKHPLLVRRSTSAQLRKAFLTIPRITLLIRISRTISAIMGAFVVILVFMSAKLLFGDRRSAWFAAVAMMFCKEFVFYSTLGNVDTPTTFWFALSLYFAIKATKARRWRDFIAMGITVAMTVCTKEPVAAYIIGLAAGMCLLMFSEDKASNNSLHRASRVLFDRKLIVGFTLSLILFALLNDLLTCPEAFMQRMGHWLGHAGHTTWNKGYTGQLNLLTDAGRDLYGAIGWPLLLACVLSLLHCIKKYPKQTLFAIAPALVFYLLVIVQVRYTTSRFYLQAFPGLCLITGKGMADFTRRKSWKTVRWSLAALTLILSLSYCATLILEMQYDTRHRVADWFAGNIPAKTNVAALASKFYSPQLVPYGFYYTRRWIPGQQQTVRLLQGKPSWPPYVIMVDFAYKNACFEPKLKDEIFSGALGYYKVAEFHNIFLYPAKISLGIAGWPCSAKTFISPKIVVMKKGPAIQGQGDFFLNSTLP